MLRKKGENCISSQYLSLGVTLFTKRMFKKLALATTVSLFSQVVSAVIMLTKHLTSCVLWHDLPEAHWTLDHMAILKLKEMVHPKTRIRSSLSVMHFLKT